MLSKISMHDRRFANQKFEIIEYDGKDVGYFSVEREKYRIKLNQIYILPEHQGSGIGKEVMLKLEPRKWIFESS